MSNKIFKNYQVNVGVPFQIKTPLNFATIKKINALEQAQEEDTSFTAKEDAEGITARAREEAENIVKEAQLEAIRFMEEAQREIESSRNAVEDEARKQGYEDGLNAAQKQYEDLLQEAELIREQAKMEYKETLAGIENDALEMIMDIARNVIGTDLSFNKEDMLYLVKQAFDKCTNKESIILRISPEDYEYITQNKERLSAMVEGLGEFEIKRDASMKPGACIVETPLGNIDAGVETKLRKMEESFRQLIGK